MDLSSPTPDSSPPNVEKNPDAVGMTPELKESSRDLAYGETLVQGSQPIHTSDRILFKRCRRKWNYGSPSRMGLVAKGLPSSPLWFGTGFHFAMEDYHGLNFYGDPRVAFEAYYKAHRPSELPMDQADLLELGKEMLGHYLNWLVRRNDFVTVWVDGQPQVEVDFAIPLGVHNGKTYHYAGTFDRVVQDAYGRYWLVDYKTAARFDVSKLDTDPQVSAYMWAAQELYGVPFEGMVYQQHLKSAPKPPRLLQDGSFSCAKNQNTTAALFRRALMEKGLKSLPSGSKYAEYLSYLQGLESPDADKFIRRDLVRRNQHQIRSAAEQILMELSEMSLGDELPIYPNPTKDCSWDCPFKQLCVAHDDGSDEEFLMRENYISKEQRIRWRSRLREQRRTQEEMGLATVVGPATQTETDTDGNATSSSSASTAGSDSTTAEPGSTGSAASSS